MAAPQLGTSTGELLTGTTLGDDIQGLGGNDTISALEGNDTADGGQGKDTLDGGAGNDILTGGSAEVEVDANGDPDAANAEDTLDGGTGNDTLDGGIGDDLYKVDNVGDIVTENSDVSTEIDTVDSFVTYTLGSNLEDLNLKGSSAIDGIGNDANNHIFGNDAKNTIDGDTGNDALVGGKGNDTYKVDANFDFVSESGTSGAEEGIDTVQSSVTYTLGNASGDDGFNVENLTLIGNDTISGTGNDLNNYIIGNNAVNTITGGVGADTIDGGLSNDTMVGGEDNDLYFVSASGDVITEVSGEGTGDVVKSASSYTLDDEVEKLELTGTNQTSGTGNDLANKITGNSVSNTLKDGGDTTNDNTNTATNGTGLDTLIGGTGDDVYLVSNKDDVVTETSTIATEIDTVKSSASEYTLTSNVENLQLAGSTGLKGVGNGLNNDIKITTSALANGDVTVAGATSVDNIIDGKGGADTMAGGAGNDTYGVDNMGDVVTEASSAGTDKVESSITYTLDKTNLENLTLTGSASINATGNSVANTVAGNSGSNIIDGGIDVVGTDTTEDIDLLSGGNGGDTYIVDGGDKVKEDGTDALIDTVKSSVTFSLTDPATTDGFTAVENVENLTLVDVKDTSGAVTNNADATGNTKANTIIGNGAVNVIDGKAGKDTMVGGAGDDTYTVDDAGDKVSENLNAGTDKVEAVLQLLPANATLPIRPDTYTLGANIEHLEFTDKDADDTNDIAVNGVGNTLANIMTGNSKENILDGGTGKDTMTGGKGNDTYVVDGTVTATTTTPAGTTVDEVNEASTAGAGDDDKVKVALPLIPAQAATVNDPAKPAKANTYTLAPNVENVELMGTLALNVDGNGSENDMLGNAAANTIDGKVGADTMTGGAGDDTYMVDNAGDLVTETSATGGIIDTVKADLPLVSGSPDEYTLTANVENLVLIGSNDLDGTGNELANKITGNDQKNRIDGAVGKDTMIGGKDDDTYVVDNAGDVVTETLSIADGGGIDTVEASLPLIPPVVTGATATPATYVLGVNVDNLTLTGLNPINATGNELANKIIGNDQANIIDGGAGGDKLVGNAGNDTYLVNSVNDKVNESSIVTTEIDTVKSSVTFTLTDPDPANVDIAVENVENLVLLDVKNPTSGVVTNNINGTGNAKANTIVGNGANNQLNGEAGNDKIDGGAGKDTIDGGAGVDTLIGGVGDDVYFVDDLGDTVTESSTALTEKDTINSSVNYNLTTTGINVENLTLIDDDPLVAGEPDINGTGNALANTITGNTGDNDIDGKAGKDTMIGGAGADDYTVDDALDVITETVVSTAAAEKDTVTSSASYILSANVEDLTLTGSTGLPTSTSAINGTGNASDNIIKGNDGANVIDGKGGIDAMTGNGGNDTYIVDDAGDTVLAETATGGTADLVQSSIDYSLSAANKGANVENLTLTGIGVIDGTGNTLNNTLLGNTKDNTLDGKAGNDIMTGGDGSDTYVVDSILDKVTETNVSTEATQKDTVQSSVAFTLGTNLEDLTLTATASGVHNAINGTGNAVANTIIGNNAANTLDGKTGADIMQGGLGNDTYMVDNANDLVQNESSTGGTDTVKATLPLIPADASTSTPATAATYTLTSNVENLILTSANAVNGTGNGGKNTITGNTFANVLDGGTGIDTLIGGTGNDTYVIDTDSDVITETSTSTSEIDTVRTSFDVTTGDGYIIDVNVENLELKAGTGNAIATGNSLNNKITGNDGNNNVDGSGGNDNLIGNGGADILTGGVGIDSLVGGDGADRFIGDGGNDILTGGANADTSVYNTAFVFSTGGFGIDVISDFTTGEDKIELGLTTFNKLASTAGAGFNAATDFAVVDTDALAATNAAFITYSSGTGRLFYNQNGATSGFGTGAQFATLTGSPVIDENDFIVANEV
jgi:Ca2+-binding RTX toxin-like protein